MRKILGVVLLMMAGACQLPTPQHDSSPTTPVTPSTPSDPNGPISVGQQPEVAGGQDIAIVAGDQYLLYWGDLLAPNGWIKNGQMLVDPSGTIVALGSSVESNPHAATATRILSPGGLAGPGLIDADRHVGFWDAPVTVAVADRYDQRHQWRTGVDSHTKLTIAGGQSAESDVLQAVIDGVTSLMASTTVPAGLTRNLAAADPELGSGAGDFETFPLKDTAGISSTVETPTYNPIPASTFTLVSTGRVAEVGMGINGLAQKEFKAFQDAGLQIAGVAIAGGAGLRTQDLATLPAQDTGLIWTPHSDLVLYGDTARVTTLKNLGGQIALGTYWNQTGSRSVLRELQTAARFNATYLNHAFNNRELYDMATKNAADVLGFSQLGRLKVGSPADFVVYRKGAQSDYTVPLGATPASIALVFRQGKLLSGDDALAQGLMPSDPGYSQVDVGGTTKRIYVNRVWGKSWEVVGMSAKTPVAVQIQESELTVVPSRPTTSLSSAYTGVPTALDLDGDGLANGVDSAPTVFNPPRPGDSGHQGDADSDGIGDEVDPAPTVAHAGSSSPPAAPTQVTIQLEHTNAVRISWAAVAGAINYLVLRDTAGPYGSPATVYFGPDLTAADLTVVPGGRYCFFIQAVNASGKSAMAGGDIVEVPSATLVQANDSSRVDYLAAGRKALFEGLVVTHVLPDSYFVQDPAGGDYGGSYIFVGSAPAVAVGDQIDVLATTVLSYGLPELNPVTVTVRAHNATLPSPRVVSEANLADGAPAVSRYYSELVQTGPIVWKEALGSGTYSLFSGRTQGGLLIGSKIYTLPPPSGTPSWTTLTGIVWRNQGHDGVLPRSAADLVP